MPTVETAVLHGMLTEHGLCFTNRETNMGVHNLGLRLIIAGRAVVARYDAPTNT